MFAASKWSNRSDWKVCLSSQCSADLLHWVVEQTKTWSGPMSVAVFAPDVDYTIASVMIQYMTVCFPRIKEQVSFHIIYPGAMPSKLMHTEVLDFDCERPEEVNNELIRMIRTKELKKMLKAARYPQNLLRNIGRQGCQADFCFTPDIDMLSLPLFAHNINQFLSQPEVHTCKRCSFIIPTYEISTDASRFPENKSELISYIKNKQARIFHIKVYSNNQANSNLSYWESHVSNGSQYLSIAYNITTWKLFWEPIYISKSNVPAFDERFIGYGYTRNSQVR